MRLRRRTVLVSSLITLTLGVMVWQGIPALSHLGWPSADDETGAPANTGAEASIKTGTVWGNSYTVTTNPSDGGLCMHVDISGYGGSGGCGFPVPETNMVGLNETQIPDLDGTFIMGPVSKLVHTVQLTLSDAQVVTTTPFAGPFGYTVDFYTLAVDGLVEVVQVAGLDALGNVLQNISYD